MPSSSPPIERDIGTAGRMVTPQRNLLAPYNVDMATFSNCNRRYVDITQSPKLSSNSAEKRLPSNVLMNMVQDLDAEFGSLANCGEVGETLAPWRTVLALVRRL
ncbi:hypothetical protein PHMEG_0009329 [Phytophthora megakarya]|uniref:Uncharacterized protein n=1 Tax=Phytophthora megakarya TaxID=4795 RepID=A0A225WI88_9STRA|nr:hypothetical protein PHMEG_0009329 [Phytophthora megakarya]